MTDFPLYMDETWIFSKGGMKRIWQDENIKSIKHSGSATEGKRHIVVHAGGKQGFVKDAGLIFSSKSKSADYHDNMNTDMYTKWLREKLLPSLTEPSVIVIDNAPYHSEVIHRQPTSGWKKDEIITWLKQENINFSNDALKSELLLLCKRHEKPKQYKVDNIIHEHGHQVLRLPPYHCEFNPIELVWGICKNYYDRHIGRNGYSDEAVREMWNEALEKVTPEIWQNCIKKTETIISQWWEREQHINEISPIIINPDEDSDSDENNLDEEFNI